MFQKLDIEFETVIVDEAHKRVGFHAQHMMVSPVRGEFTYRVPEALRGKLFPGQRVRVPFGRQSTLGFFLAPAPEPSAEGTKRSPSHGGTTFRPNQPLERTGAVMWFVPVANNSATGTVERLGQSGPTVGVSPAG